MLIRTITLRKDQRGLLFRDNELIRVLGPGRHRYATWRRERVDAVSTRSPWLIHEELPAMLETGLFGDELLAIDLKDSERALVWVDHRFETVLAPGLYGIWTCTRKVRVQTVDARTLRLEHADLPVILASQQALQRLRPQNVPATHVGILRHRGRILEVLKPGQYATWQGMGEVTLQVFDLREQVLDVCGQDIMTADKVTLRLNAVLTYRVADPVKAAEAVSDIETALHRETQLVLRTEVGLRQLDKLLGEKDAVAAASADTLRSRAADLGLELRSLGIRDLILPGEMKNLLNQVIEAQKASEANSIRRREETAAVRSQLNTAKLMESNPTLMRMRELEVLERVAEQSQLQVILGDQERLGDRISKLI